MDRAEHAVQNPPGDNGEPQSPTAKFREHCVVIITLESNESAACGTIAAKSGTKCGAGLSRVAMPSPSRPRRTGACPRAVAPHQRFIARDPKAPYKTNRAAVGAALIFSCAQGGARNVFFQTDKSRVPVEIGRAHV